MSFDTRGVVAAQRLVAGEHGHAVALQRLLRIGRYLGILAHHDAIEHLDLRDLRAQARKGLRQLAADRPATEHHQARRLFAQFPQRVAGQHAGLLDAGQRRHERRRAGGHHDGAGRQRGRAAIGLGDLHVPRVDDPGLAEHHVDAQAAVALDRIVRLDRRHHALHALHHVGERHLRMSVGDAVGGAVAHLVHQLGRLDQRLARHAAVVEAVAAHLVALDQRHLGLHGGRDVARHQPGGTGTDHHQIAVEAPGLAAAPARIDAPRLDRIDDLLGDDRKHAQQHERTDQCGRQDARERLDLRQLRARIHVHQRAGQHAELAHPVEGGRFHRWSTPSAG